MKILTKQEIVEINNKYDSDYRKDHHEGIFLQPNGVPTNIKEHVIYACYKSSGADGGNCWGDEAREFYNSRPNNFIEGILDLIFEVLQPDVSFLKYKKIKDAFIESDYRESEYYGNYSNHDVYYLPLSEFYKLLYS